MGVKLVSRSDLILYIFIYYICSYTNHVVDSTLTESKRNSEKLKNVDYEFATASLDVDFEETEGMLSRSAKGMPFLLYLHVEEIAELGVAVAADVNHRRVEIEDIAAAGSEIEHDLLVGDATMTEYSKFQTRELSCFSYVPTTNPEAGQEIPFNSLSYFKYGHNGKTYDGITASVEGRGANPVSEKDMKALAWLWKIPNNTIAQHEGTNTFVWDSLLRHLSIPRYYGIGASVEALNNLVDHLGFDFNYGNNVDPAVANRDFKRIYQALTSVRFAPYDGGHRTEFIVRLFNGHEFGHAVPLGDPSPNRTRLSTNSTLCRPLPLRITSTKIPFIRPSDIEAFRNLSFLVQKNSIASFEQGWKSIWRRIVAKVEREHFAGGRNNYTYHTIYTMQHNKRTAFLPAFEKLINEIACTVLFEYASKPTNQYRIKAYKDIPLMVEEFRNLPGKGTKLAPIPDELDPKGTFKPERFRSVMLHNAQENDALYHIKDNLGLHVLLSVIPIMSVAAETRKALNNFASSSQPNIHDPYRVAHFQIMTTNRAVSDVRQTIIKRRGPIKAKIQFLARLAYMQQMFNEVATHGYRSTDIDNWEPFTLGTEKKFDGYLCFQKMKVQTPRPIVEKAGSADDYSPSTPMHCALLTFASLEKNYDIDIPMNSYGKGTSQFQLSIDDALRRPFTDYLHDVLTHKDACLNRYTARHLGITLQYEIIDGKPTAQIGIPEKPAPKITFLGSNPTTEPTNPAKDNAKENESTAMESITTTSPQKESTEKEAQTIENLVLTEATVEPVLRRSTRKRTIKSMSESEEEEEPLQEDNEDEDEHPNDRLELNFQEIKLYTTIYDEQIEKNTAYKKVFNDVMIHVNKKMKIVMKDLYKQGSEKQQDSVRDIYVWLHTKNENPQFAETN